MGSCHVFSLNVMTTKAPSRHRYGTATWQCHDVALTAHGSPDGTRHNRDKPYTYTPPGNSHWFFKPLPSSLALPASLLIFPSTRVPGLLAVTCSRKDVLRLLRRRDVLRPSIREEGKHSQPSCLCRICKGLYLVGTLFHGAYGPVIFPRGFHDNLTEAPRDFRGVSAGVSLPMGLPWGSIAWTHATKGVHVFFRRDS